MLILSRKTNEQIVIGDRIVVTVVEIRGDRVRLGVDAPREVSVHRKEIFEVLREAHPEPSNGFAGLGPDPVEAEG